MSAFGNHHPAPAQSPAPAPAQTPAQPPAPAQAPADDGITRLHSLPPTADLTGLWRALRERYGPIVPVEIDPGVRAWLLLGYHHNLTALRDATMFRRDPRAWREIQEGRVDPTTSRPPFSSCPTALHTDGNDHRRLRAPIANSLNRISTSAALTATEAVAEQLIAGFVGTGRADLVNQYAQLLPLMVASRLFGFPSRTIRELGGLTTAVYDNDPQRANAAATQLQEHFAELVDRAHKRPGHNLLSWLIADPVGLSDEETAHQSALVSATGHQPLAHLIGNALRTLLTGPSVMNAYTSGRLNTQELLDYVMWTAPPLQVMAARFATQDARIGNASIRAGDAILIGFGAAHSDPAVVGEHQERIAGNRAHLMFGAGAHACPAQDLARTIASVAVESAVGWLSDLRLAVPPNHLRGTATPFMYGPLELPVDFTPREPPVVSQELPETDLDFDPAEEEATEDIPDDRDDPLDPMLKRWLDG